MTTVFVSLIIVGTTVPARAMLSVCDTAIATQKVSPKYEQCSCSVPLVLSNTAQFLYDQVADIRPRQTNGVVTTLTGNTLQNTHSTNRTHIASVLLVQVLHGVQCNLWLLSGSSNVQITKHACKHKRELFIARRKSNNPDLINHYKRYCKIPYAVFKEDKIPNFAHKNKKSLNKNKTICDMVNLETNKTVDTEKISTLNIDGNSISDRQEIANSFNKYILTIAESIDTKQN